MMMRHIKTVFVTVSLLLSPILVAEPLTPNQLHATLGIVTNFILDDDGIQFHGKRYKPVTSPHTGRVWLDRNLGASQVCTSFNDTACYGDYYQWGRAYDGHESSVDSTTVLATDINNAGAEFIRGNVDWASTDLSYGNARATNWLKTDGSSVCPVGYRVPLRSELDAEVGDISNKETAYANFLRFPVAGWRDYFNANYYDVGTWGTVWSVSSTLNKASYFRFYSISNWNDLGDRAYGLSVRCIKHEGKPLIYHNTTTYATVASPYTGKVWLDRNLGASQVCTAFDDTSCYGDYYQWGRGFDGHQDANSSTTSIRATNVNVTEASFISITTSPFDWVTVDSDGSTRAANWSKIDGSSVCPVGFRVPTLAELLDETISNGVTNGSTAFNNFLKLPYSGRRYSGSAFVLEKGLGGYVWSSSVDSSRSSNIGFNSSSANINIYYRPNALPVRCLKN